MITNIFGDCSEVYVEVTIHTGDLVIPIPIIYHLFLEGNNYIILLQESEFDYFYEMYSPVPQLN